MCEIYAAVAVDYSGTCTLGGKPHAFLRAHKEYKLNRSLRNTLAFTKSGDTNDRPSTNMVTRQGEASPVFDLSTRGPPSVTLSRGSHLCPRVGT